MPHRHQRFRQTPQVALHRVIFGIALAHEDAEEHARDVGIENRGTLAERKAADRAGRVCADALEREQRFLVGRQLSAVASNRFSRDRLQALRSDVVAKRVPRVRHFLFGCRSQRFERRVLVEPFGVLRQHAIDLRLLQHDFRDEDVVRVVGLAPGQIAPVTPVPGEQPRSKPSTFGRGGNRQRRRASSSGVVDRHLV